MNSARKKIAIEYRRQVAKYEKKKWNERMNLTQFSDQRSEKNIRKCLVWKRKHFFNVSVFSGVDDFFELDRKFLNVLII